MMAEDMISHYGQIETICYILAAALLITAVFMFFFLKIPQAALSIKRQSVPYRKKHKAGKAAGIENKETDGEEKQEPEITLDVPNDMEIKESATDTTGSPQEGIKIRASGKAGTPDDFEINKEIIIVHDR